MNSKYILKGHTPVAEPNLMKWVQWFGEADATVAQTTVAPGVNVSTVFLGLDYNDGVGAPILFETMIFGGERNGECHRYSAWEEAAKGHQEIVDSFAGESR
jgi:hypothetical protein